MTNTEKTEAMAGLTHVAAQLKEAQRRTEAHMILAKAAGASWAEIGAILGITKQAAQQKYAKMHAADAAMTAPDVTGPSITPSIFLEPKAPGQNASEGTDGRKVTRPQEPLEQPARA